jgi:hypothetical protein
MVVEVRLKGASYWMLDAGGPDENGYLACDDGNEHCLDCNYHRSGNNKQTAFLVTHVFLNVK